jgi:hypothetical protein
MYSYDLYIQSFINSHPNITEKVTYTYVRQWSLNYWRKLNGGLLPSADIFKRYIKSLMNTINASFE